MTDNEIIKALECFAIDKDFDVSQCVGCAFESKSICCENASEGIAKASLDLINRQQAEIMETRRDLLNEIYALEHQLETTKAETIKEFAERLKENAHTVDDDYSPNGEITYIEVDDIDNVTKEMVGEYNA